MKMTSEAIEHMIETVLDNFDNVGASNRIKARTIVEQLALASYYVIVDEKLRQEESIKNSPNVTRLRH